MSGKIFIAAGSHMETEISLQYKDDRAVTPGITVFWDMVLCILQVSSN